MAYDYDDEYFYEYCCAQVDEYREDPYRYFLTYLDTEDIAAMTQHAHTAFPVCLENSDGLFVLSLGATLAEIARRAPEVIGEPEQVVKNLIRETPADYLIRKWAENPPFIVISLSAMLEDEPGITPTQAARIRDAFEIEGWERAPYRDAIERCGLTFDELAGRWTYPDADEAPDIDE